MLLILSLRVIVSIVVITIVGRGWGRVVGGERGDCGCGGGDGDVFSIISLLKILWLMVVLTTISPIFNFTEC